MYQGQTRLHEQALEHVQLYHGERVELTHSCSLLEPGRSAPAFTPIRLVITNYQVVFKCEDNPKDSWVRGRPCPIFYVPLMCIYSVWREDTAQGESRRLVYIQTKTVQLFLLRFHLRYPRDFRVFDNLWRLLHDGPHYPVSNYFCWAAFHGAVEQRHLHDFNGHTHEDGCEEHHHHHNHSGGPSSPKWPLPLPSAPGDEASDLNHDQVINANALIRSASANDLRRRPVAVRSLLNTLHLTAVPPRGSTLEVRSPNSRGVRHGPTFTPPALRRSSTHEILPLALEESGAKETSGDRINNPKSSPQKAATPTRPVASTNGSTSSAYDHLTIQIPTLPTTSAPSTSGPAVITTTSSSSSSGLSSDGSVGTISSTSSAGSSAPRPTSSTSAQGASGVPVTQPEGCAGTHSPPPAVRVETSSATSSPNPPTSATTSMPTGTKMSFLHSPAKFLGRMLNAAGTSTPSSSGSITASSTPGRVTHPALAIARPHRIPAWASKRASLSPLTPMSAFSTTSIVTASTPCTPMSLPSGTFDKDSNFVCEYQIDLELQRMARNPEYRRRWRISCANQNFKVCPSYPDRVIVPADLTDSELRLAASFRGHGRFPMISWIHPTNGSVLARCSQPLRGPTSLRCAEDERLVSLLIPASDFPRMAEEYAMHRIDRLAIADARGYASALGNTAKGGGYEVPEHYRHAQHLNLDLPNIHAIRESWLKLCRLSHVSCDSWPSDKWLSELVNTGWMGMVQNIVQKAFQIVLFQEEQASSVLVHCTDGWDRTSQLCSLASLLVDPYYRTIRGFQILIEKEWLMAGHRFAERCGTGGEKPNDMYSPIFLQWMDCVWQVWRQHSTAFEFNDWYLSYIVEHVYSCRFGTFLCNSFKERLDMDLANRTLSLWDNINAKKARFHNVLYDDTNPRILVPSRHHSQIVLWDSLYFSFHSNQSIWRQRHFGYVSVQSRLFDLSRKLARQKSRIREEEQMRTEAMMEELVREMANQAVEESTAKLQERAILGQYEVALPSAVGPEELETVDSIDPWASRPEGYVRWVPDHLARTCAFCSREFHMFRRKHHCRSCGRVFCHNDCKPLAGVRTCRRCATSLLEAHSKSQSQTSILRPSPTTPLNTPATALTESSGSHPRHSPALMGANSTMANFVGSPPTFLPTFSSGVSELNLRQPTALLLPHLL